MKLILFEFFSGDGLDIRCGITGGAWTPMLYLGGGSSAQLLALLNLSLAHAFVSAKVEVGERLRMRVGEKRKIVVQVQHLDARPKLFGGAEAMLRSDTEQEFWTQFKMEPGTTAEPLVLRGGMAGSDSVTQVKNLLDWMQRS